MRRILIYSSAFHPNVGGMEFVARTIAELLSGCGYCVTVVTRTHGSDSYQYPFTVLRNPPPFALMGAYRNADVALHMNVSLRALWPLALFRRPLVFVHNGFYRRVSGRLGLRDRLKYWMSRLAINVACSEAVARDLPAHHVVIGNPYDSELFDSADSGERTGDLLFVGRLVSEKGVDLLLQSLAALADHKLSPRLTIVGSGPEEELLRRICTEAGLLNRVTFCGTISGLELAALMSQHKIMVIPSRSEGFGVVALEGIASGCLVIASDAGGLPEAVGDCGLIFRRGDVGELTQALVRGMTDGDLPRRLAQERSEHLSRFSRHKVGAEYLKVIEAALTPRRTGPS